MRNPALQTLVDRAPISRTVTHDCTQAEFEAARQRIDAGLDWGVGAIVTDHEDHVLLVHEHGRWQAPGGEVEDGETHEVAVRREVAEETGVLVDPGELVAVIENRYRFDGEERAFAFAHYEATLDGDPTVAADPGLDDEDIEAVAWHAEIPENTLQADVIRTAFE